MEAFVVLVTGDLGEVLVSRTIVLMVNETVALKGPHLGGEGAEAGLRVRIEFS